MLLFILAVLVYTIALAGISQLTSNTSYLPLLSLLQKHSIYYAAGSKRLPQHSTVLPCQSQTQWRNKW
ncbi:hypothetical protein ACB092_09G185000 [Castanea dentata]